MLGARLTNDQALRRTLRNRMHYRQGVAPQGPVWISPCGSNERLRRAQRNALRLLERACPRRAHGRPLHRDGLRDLAAAHGAGRSGERRPDSRSLLHSHERAEAVQVPQARQVRPGGPQGVELFPPRLAPVRADQDGPGSLRSRLGGLSGRPRDRADPRRLRLSLAGDQQHAPLPLARRCEEFAAHQGSGDGFLHPRHAHAARSATRASGSMSAASATIRAPTRRSSISTPALCAIGRA